MRVVLDTNIYISLLITPNSKPAAVFEAALQSHDLVVSQIQYDELLRVLAKPKLKHLLLWARVDGLLAELKRTNFITPTTPVTDCRDANDNHILALALDGKADLIVSGDDDLLVLHPWRGILILSATEALPKL